MKYCIVLFLVLSGCWGQSATIAAKNDVSSCLSQDGQQIIGQNDRIYFGVETYLLDKYVTQISNSEYFSARGMYHNAIDTLGKIELRQNSYFIPLANGEIKELVNIASDLSDEMEVYNSVGAVDCLDSELFSVSTLGGWRYLLVSKKNGRIEELRDYPYLSAACDYLATLRTDEEGTACGTLELFKTGPETIEFFAGLWSTEILPVEGYWFGDTTFYFAAEYQLPDYSRETRYYKIKIDTIERGEAHPISEKWIGNYFIEIDYGPLDEFSEMSISYCIEITGNDCKFSGVGYNTYFTDVCGMEENGDELRLFYIESLDGDGFSDHSDLNTIATLFRVGSRYCIKSPLIADEHWEYNKKLPIRTQNNNNNAKQ